MSYFQWVNHCRSTARRTIRNEKALFIIWKVMEKEFGFRIENILSCCEIPITHLYLCVLFHWTLSELIAREIKRFLCSWHNHNNEWLQLCWILIPKWIINSTRQISATKCNDCSIWTICVHARCYQTQVAHILKKHDIPTLHGFK